MCATFLEVCVIAECVYDIVAITEPKAYMIEFCRLTGTSKPLIIS